MSTLVGRAGGAAKRSVFAISTIGITGVSVFLLYRATQVSGESVHNAFFSGLVLAFSAVGSVWARSARKSGRKSIRERRDFEEEIHLLRRTVAVQRCKLEDVSLEVEELTAAGLFLRVPIGREASVDERSLRVISDR